MYSMRFDMRAPDFGASPADLYQAAIDMCKWSETRGGPTTVRAERRLTLTVWIFC
jgi:hypothetical protein